MKKILLILLFVTAYSGLLHAQTAPTTPVQMNQVTWYYEPSTTLRWGFNATRGWFLVPDSAKVVQWIGGRGGGDTVSFQQDQFINTGTITNAHIALRAKDTTGVDSVLAWKNNKLYKILGGGGGTNLGNSDLTQTDPTRTFTIGTGSLVFTGANGTTLSTVTNSGSDGFIVDETDSSNDTESLLVVQPSGANLDSHDAVSASDFFTTSNGSSSTTTMQVQDLGTANNKTIQMSFGTGSYPLGIVVTDPIDGVGLTSPTLFTVSGDPNQYVQFGNLSGGGGNTIYTADDTLQSDRTVFLSDKSLLITDPTGDNEIEINHGTILIEAGKTGNAAVTLNARDTVSGRNSNLVASAGTSDGNERILLQNQDGGNFQQLSIRPSTGFIFRNDAGLGAGYDSSIDTAASISQFGGQWIPNKEFNDEHYAAIGSSGGVPSVFGRTGAVVAATNDYTFAQIGTKPTTLSGYGITDAYPLTGNPSSFLTGNQTIALSGDVSGSGATAITTTIGAAKVTNTMLAGSIAASKLVGTDITTVGTLSAGSIPYSLLTGTPSALPPSGTAGGELAGTYPNPTLLNSAIIAKVLTGYTSSSGTVASTDNILQAIQKLNGNDGLKLNISDTAAMLGLMVHKATTETITGAKTATSVFTGLKTAIGATLSDGFKLSNTTAAISGTQQYAPALHWQGNGFGSTAGTSQSIDFYANVMPSQGGVPTGTWQLSSSVNGSTPSVIFTIGSGGAVTALNNISAGGNNVIGGTGQFDILKTGGGTVLALGIGGNFNTINSDVVNITRTINTSSGTSNGFAIRNTWNQTSTANGTDFLINRVETAAPNTQKFMSLQVAGSEKFAISNTNLFSFAGTPGTAGQMPIVNASGTAMTWVTAYTGLITGTPTIVAGTGAGTSPTVSVTTNGKQLQVTVTTGTLPTGTNATIATVTLPNALSYTPLPVFSSASAATALLNGASMIYMTSTGTANVTITSGTTALTAATTYVWNVAL